MSVNNDFVKWLTIKDDLEAEAMPARILRGLLRDAIEELIPGGALAAAKVAEASERAGLRLLAARCAT